MARRHWRGEGQGKNDGRTVLLGDRSWTWIDESEEGEFAGLEEPFPILHKATLHTIKEERDKNPLAKLFRTATAISALSSFGNSRG